MSIYVWGTGCGASELLERGLALEQITAFIDSNPSGPEFMGKPVLLPRELPVRECGLVIVTTRHADAVAGTCAELGIPDEKLLFLKNNCSLSDRNAACTAAEAVLGKALLDRLLPPQHIVPTPMGLLDSILDGPQLRNDYVRLATLELLCRRLHNIPGAAAELGVYRGAFARCINTLLPERTLYLFDSFDGFLPAEGAKERAENTCSDAFLAAHRNTTAQAVRDSMPHKEHVVMKVGFFPESLEGLEDRFCLVSLDADFQDTTLEGLRYFWPRLNPGGCLLLHDWGDTRLTGVAAALERYEAETGQRVPSVPLPDIGGTLVLCK